MPAAVANAADYIVEAENLTKIYRDFWGRPKARAVDRINLRIRSGQIFGLLGPNGSGKSTTVKMILGLLYPNRGRIRVFGQSPRNVEIKRRIGYQPEETYLYPYLTAAETLDFFGSILGIHERERRNRIRQLLAMVGLERVGSRTVGEFSKGMARRLALAQALINDPDLVVLDEPTVGLDPLACREIKDVIRVLGERGKTILLCSHVLADVEDVCDSVAVLYGGRICAEGSVREILQIQEQTRIVAPAMSEGVLAEVCRLLKEKAGADDLTIDHPRMSLEQFFLNVVRQAQSGSMETSGAQAGTGIAEFLEAGPGSGADRRILEQLAVQEPRTPTVPDTGADRDSEKGGGRGAAEAEQDRAAARRLEKLTRAETPKERPGNSEEQRREQDEARRIRASEKLRDLLESDDKTTPNQ